ncbi:coiled-coil domain-containing protein 14 isoform X3 [Phyllostomus discolor]|uniref:Coiled-coil domain-containing protein 14 isoform X3 n=1 Tax=Phyllostomus discolor TaxID=89673 RepID=A0A7E6D720_9CHIR|nr:coiled-coil domain-containing protein 14 isoform X3 [Phyllostomus discolor]
MVRSGSRQGQVLSSGKHAAPAKLTNGKKSTYLRKISRFNADSGHPIHSDSESQTEAVRGLDGCASLLQNILRNEDSGSEIAYSENRYNPRPLEGKRYGSKKKGHEKHTLPSLVRKEILSSDYKKQISNETSAGSERDSSDIPQNWSFQDHYRMYSPIIYQALCEHVQTQMSLMNNSASKNNPNGIPAVPCHTGSGSDSQATPHSSHGLPTSTPVQLPQQLPCPPVVHSEVQTDGDNQSASQHKTVCVNCTDILRNTFSTSLGVQCSLPKTDKAAIPAFQQLDLANGILPQQEVSKEPDLLQCFQTYMNLLRSYPDSQTHRSPTLLQPAVLATNEEKCVKEQIGEVTSEGKDLNIHVRDSRIKGVQKAKNGSQSAEKVRIIKYLLGELKALVAEQEDSEIQRLITELEACVSLLPAANGNTNIQVEIALAMQPLRSENAQLRRTLQSSMAKLLSDLSMDTARCKPGNNLTKSLLNIYEKQPQHDPVPAQISIMSYLNKLETDPTFTHSEPLCEINNEENIVPDRPYENVLPSKGPQHSDPRSMEEALAPGIISTLSKQHSDEESKITTLIEGDCNLDNTIYIPFARSTSKRKSPLSKRLSPQPQISVTRPPLLSNSGPVSEKENRTCAPGVCSSSKKEAEHACEKLSTTAEMEDKQLLKKIKEAICKISAATEGPQEPAVCHGPSTCQSSSFQVKSSTVCDGSFLNSDLMSDWSISSFSTFTSRDEQDFRNGLAALDANIARLQESLRSGVLEK